MLVAYHGRMQNWLKLARQKFSGLVMEKNRYSFGQKFEKIFKNNENVSSGQGMIDDIGHHIYLSKSVQSNSEYK